MTGAAMIVRAAGPIMASSTSSAIPAARCCRFMTRFSSRAKSSNILVRHEQGAGHAAEGYARSTGLPGVVLVTSGPGATNMVTPLCDALMDSIPLVCITGQVPTHLIGNDAFQECDTVGITRPCTKAQLAGAADRGSAKKCCTRRSICRDHRPSRSGRGRRAEGRAVRHGTYHPPRKIGRAHLLFAAG